MQRLAREHDSGWGRVEVLLDSPGFKRRPPPSWFPEEDGSRSAASSWLWSHLGEERRAESEGTFSFHQHFQGKKGAASVPQLLLIFCDS